MMREAGLRDVALRGDLAGHDRVALGATPGPSGA